MSRKENDAGPLIRVSCDEKSREKICRQQLRVRQDKNSRDKNDADLLLRVR